MKKLLSLLLILGFLITHHDVGRAQDGVAALSPSKITKRALLIGINRYRYPNVIPPLSGSVNDVEDMKALLIGKFDFAPENILLLTDEKATHAGIISAIEDHLINKTQEGDIVVLHYSGHGSQMKDLSNESSSGLDETLVPYDSRDPQNKVFDISGTELKPLFRRLANRTRNITVILDSCHSGSLVKGSRVRTIPPDQRQPPASLIRSAQTNTTGNTASFSPKAQTGFMYALIAAASSREVAFERFEEGKDRGALTYFLTRELRSAPAGVTYRDIMDRVTGNVTLHHPSQHPQLEGLQADQHVFGDTDSVAQTYALVSPAAGGRVSLGSGEVQGVTVGSIFEIYAPGTKKFEEPQKPVGRLEVIEVKPFTAVGKLLSGSNVPKFSRAVEREHNYRGLQLYVYLDSVSDSSQFRSVRDALSTYKHVQVVNDARTAHLRLTRDGNQFSIFGNDESRLSLPMDLDDANLVSKVTEAVDRWARWFNFLSIRNTAPTIKAELQIKTTRDGKTKDPFAQIEAAGATAFEGDYIEVTVHNKSAKALYFALIDLQTDGSITLLHPDPGTHEVLPAGEKYSIGFWATVPEHRTDVLDVVTLLASVQQFDAQGITQPPTKSPKFSTDPIGSLLDLARGLRPNTALPGSTGAIPAADWVTDQKVLKVIAK